MPMFKLHPAYKDYLWGGHKLVDEFHKDYDGPVLAESWELSCHPDGPSVIATGPLKGTSMIDFVAENPEALGTNCRRFKDFPVLIKLIDAKGNLSIQVHPDNEYALKHENQYGKTEMWYILEAGPDAFLYWGFKEEISEEEFRERIENDTLLEVLNAVPVHKGDVFFIEAGTIHAIGKDIVITEIQQNSNVTYRVYDYGRVDKNGKKRELHVDKAIQVTNRKPPRTDYDFGSHIGACNSFQVDKLEAPFSGTAGSDSFVSLLIADGEGTLELDGESLPFIKGDSFFITAGSGEYKVEGKATVLRTVIGPNDTLDSFEIELDAKDFPEVTLKDPKGEAIAQMSAAGPEAAMLAKTIAQMLEAQGLREDNVEWITIRSDKDIKDLCHDLAELSKLPVYPA